MFELEINKAGTGAEHSCCKVRNGCQVKEEAGKQKKKGGRGNTMRWIDYRTPVREKRTSISGFCPCEARFLLFPDLRWSRRLLPIQDLQRHHINLSWPRWVLVLITKSSAKN